MGLEGGGLNWVPAHCCRVTENSACSPTCNRDVSLVHATTSQSVNPDSTTRKS
eukprot:CAMPEP_0114151338 /NCGR_PEP_ID=MMETSP0043_2-20121206/23197_1 /TAXON_ID=464988 /ORGANISM="Hemiselmis andersenii, Strain CCMP644" /LENGTH=52 /DNA_ID=CAMNT_0001246157 /DNA_START=185 /DNA_END=339 /DNA_ORIENTATION=+